MPPYSGAAALRGESIIGNLAQLVAGEKGVILVYTTTSSPKPIEGASVESLGVPEVENSLSLKRRLLGEVWMGYVAARKMLFSRDRPDLAVVSSPGYISALVQTFFARVVGVPYVLEMRDIYPEVYAEANLLIRRGLVYRLFQRLSRSMYAKAALVLCATQGLAHGVSSQAPTSQVVHVYNGFPASLVARSAVKHSRFTVCFHGVLGFFQDVDTLIKVTDRLAQYDVDVVVIGYGRKEGVLQSCSLPNLKFLGRQTFERTIEEVERCHLGLCLRLDDGISKDSFPVKVWEYIGLGIPSIVTPPCEAGDFLQKNVCGLVLESGNVEGIVSSVLKARDDYSFLEAMSVNCRKLAMHYTREKTGLTAAQEIFCIASRFISPANTATH
jgi:glycosyltransferase involved in cell wall biosynthesis